jgi:N-acetyltransferase
MRVSIRGFQEGNLSGSALIYSVRTLDGRLIGQCGIKDIDSSNKHGELGLIIRSSMWGTRATPEAVLLTLSQAFEHASLHRVSLSTSGSNKRALQMIRNIGATLEGILRDYFRRDAGGFEDAQVFAILEAEWPACKQRLIEYGDRRCMV